MGNVGSSSQPERPRRKVYRFLGWSAAGVFLLGVLAIYHYRYPTDPRCAALLAHPDNDVVIPLPVDCKQTRSSPDDEMMKYLENERRKRGLEFRAWITCTPSTQIESLRLAFTQDPRWLPSYVPDAYQFRQTVIILPYAQPIPRGSPVAAEVCLMSRSRYASLIAEQCDGKFSVWK